MVEVREALAAARAVESLGWLPPGDWPDVAVALLVDGAEDAELAELGGYGRDVSGWVTEPLVAMLYDRYVVDAPAPDDAVRVVAGLMAADLRSRPATVTAPMVRLLAKLAPPDYISELAVQAWGAEEYLDCDCAEVDLGWEAELEALPGPAIPDRVISAIAAPLRRSLPLSPPQRGHGHG